MVDVTDITAANSLMNEDQQITAALNNLNNGGRITSMTIDGPPDEANVMATVPTGYIQYPPQMVAGIKAALEGRQHEIDQQLADMGFTGTGGRSARAHSPATASAPRRR